MNLILSSGSPRRKQLLDLLSIPYQVIPADIDEQVEVGETPLDYVSRVDIEKALNVSSKNSGYVIGGDFIVVYDGKVLGKPKSRKEAIQTLTMLSGERHEALCSAALCKDLKVIYKTVSRVEIKFRNLTTKEIEEYVQSGETDDKAGSYAVQGRGGEFVETIKGDIFSMVGLPIVDLAIELNKLGFKIDKGIIKKLISARGNLKRVQGLLRGNDISS